MARYVLRRLAQAVVVLWAAYTVSFLVLFLLPGDPVELMASGGLEQASADPARIAALKAEYGFDDPLLVQYFSHLWAALHGDLGNSVSSGQPVLSTLRQALPSTAAVASTAAVLAILLGASLAFLATYTRSAWLRQTLLSLPGLGVSLPTFWVGLLLVQLVSFRWGLVPAFGNQGWRSVILPAVTLALPTGAVVAQVFGKGLLVSLDQAYVETARAKGVGRLRIHLRHATRNATIPALTVVGLIVGNLFAGSVVVETVFARTGVGRSTVEAVTAQDIPVVQGVVVLGALVIVLANLAVDLVYPLVDPRILAGGARA